MVDIINVEHRSLRTRDIDVVDIEADAGLETPERILLTDAADEGGERRVRTAPDRQGQVWRACGRAMISAAPVWLIWSALKAEIEIGTSLAASSRRRAVTVIVSRDIAALA